MSIKKILERFPERHRTKVVQCSLGALVVVGALASYYASGQNEKSIDKKVEEARPITLGDELLEDDIRAELNRDRLEQKEHNHALSEKLVDMESSVRAMEDVLSGLKSANLDKRETEKQKPIEEVEQQTSYPMPPPVSQQFSQNKNQPFEETSLVLGGIAHVPGAAITKKEPTKKKRTFYLAPSFMEAMLLTGLKAETIEGAKENPEPMVLRVQNPAILPNHIKANLQGCFVIAHGHGRLSSERVEARLVSMNCLAQNGEAVIDEKIKGFIVDSDGTKGLRAVPVTKMGANMARVFLAGMFGGIGQVAQSNATVISTSPEGTVQTLPDGNSLLQAGVGTGISDAAADIRQVYLDLVRQSAPVLEVGPTKTVTVVLTEGVTLSIRDNTYFEETNHES